MSDFNYHDSFKSLGFNKWVSELNKKYINISAPSVQIFKLDKTITRVDELYGETEGSRIYLPPFSMRMMYLDNPWAQNLGVGNSPYLEKEENILFTVNFEDMVNEIRNLKNRHISDIEINFIGIGSGSLENTGTNLLFKKNGTLVTSFNLEDSLYSTTQKLTDRINLLSDFTATLNGDNDSSISLVPFSEMRFQGNIINVYSQDTTYINCTDIIEKGDVILTQKYKLYEVYSNLPGGDFGWDYATMGLSCNLRTLDKADLPSDYVRQIKDKEYGLRDKVKME